MEKRFETLSLIKVFIHLWFSTPSFLLNLLIGTPTGTHVFGRVSVSLWTLSYFLALDVPGSSCICSGYDSAMSPRRPVTFSWRVVFRNQDLLLRVLTDTGILLLLVDCFYYLFTRMCGRGSTEDPAAQRWKGERSEVAQTDSPLLL